MKMQVRITITIYGICRERCLLVFETFMSNNLVEIVRANNEIDDISKECAGDMLIYVSMD